MINKLLLQIKKLFAALGIEIRFIKKKKNISALYLNSVEQVNKAWADPNIIKLFDTKELRDFHQQQVDLLKRYQICISNKSVADVGCGTGMLLKFLNNYDSSISVTGYEYSDSAIAVAKKLFPKANYFTHDINNPVNQKFDIVFSTEVLEHILYANVALNNILEMVNNKGVAIVSVPNGRDDTFEGHINFWSPESWVAFIEKSTNGLKFETGKIGRNNLYAIIFK